MQKMTSITPSIYEIIHLKVFFKVLGLCDIIRVKSSASCGQVKYSSSFHIHIKKSMTYPSMYLVTPTFRAATFIIVFLPSEVKTKSEGKYVQVQLDERTNCNVWTRVFNPGVQDKYPLVMIHGMGAGCALFAMNFDELSECRTVYAIDLPGMAITVVNFSREVH
jgi:hypothetical protein